MTRPHTEPLDAHLDNPAKRLTDPYDALASIVLHLDALVRTSMPGLLSPVVAGHVQTALELAADALPEGHTALEQALDAAGEAARAADYDAEPVWDEHLGTYLL
jgi:hypothetical protein